MKRLLYAASIVHSLLLLLQLGSAYAADIRGPYDGEWAGFAISTGQQCKQALVTLNVQGTVVIGQAKFETDAPNIHGTVWQDGTFGATIGFQHLTGKFVEDKFSGTFKNGNCVWRLLLTRTKFPEGNAVAASLDEPVHRATYAHLQ
jgi:hypothetical protein